MPSVQVPALLRQLCLTRFDVVKMDIEGVWRSRLYWTR